MTDLSLCSCTNKHQPYELQGMMVVSLDPACRVHATKSSASGKPLGAREDVDLTYETDFDGDQIRALARLAME